MTAALLQVRLIAQSSPIGIFPGFGGWKCLVVDFEAGREVVKWAVAVTDAWRAQYGLGDVIFGD